MIETHARRRFRARLARNMKRRRTIASRIVKAGLSTKTAKRAAYSHKSWRALSKDVAFERMYSNKWFEDQGMFIKSKEAHDHWFAVKERIRIS